MSISRIQLIKDRLVEGFKYDFNHLKYPLVLLANLVVWSLIRTGKSSLAFKIASNIYRTGWSGGYALGVRTARYFFRNTKKGMPLIEQMIQEIPALVHTQKFFDDPKTLLGGIVIVLKSPQGNEKGALLLNYNYYFPLFLKFYDLNKISEYYNIILEPSWAGFCELSILGYSQLKNPVYVMTYEKRDRRFINDLNVALLPIDIGPSWFINHDIFTLPAENQERNIDIIMVAAWAKFKCHNHFFKILANLKKKLPNFKLVLVGYPVDMTKVDIESLALHYGIQESLTIYEWIEPSEVVELFKRSKINILWSRFEGNNRAIIEGMFCGTPVILRAGHNYGQHYDFINSETGHFADESNLVKKIWQIIDNFDNYSPRNYVMNHRNCIKATEIMNQILAHNECNIGRPWTRGLVVKTNGLHSMNYLQPEDNSRFAADYKMLTQFIIH